MNKHEKNSIKKYDSIAQSYDNSPEGRFTAKFKAKVLELCPVSDGDKVLDVGCGNGDLINAFSQKGDITAFGVDISPNMIAECRARYSDISFEVSSGEVLDFADGSLDTVTICCVLHHLHNAQNFVKEAHRVLKSGGILIIAEPWFPWGLRHLTDWIFSPLVRAGDNKIFSHKRLKRLVTDGGFEIADIYKKGVVQIVKARKV
ncbi:MAG: methyltransferase domain-containing protein [Firmicutes bacterium]|nr:methyltransferase domain-containing protein [Bacillota bacterium]